VRRIVLQGPALFSFHFAPDERIYFFISSRMGREFKIGMFLVDVLGKRNKTGRDSQMNIFFCATRLQEREKRLLRSLGKSFPKVRLEAFHACADLASRLLRPKDSVSAAVIVACRREDITSFLSIRDMISDTGIIFILPEHSPDMIALAHRLRPKFISYLDSDFSELISVLKKMIQARERHAQES
jgi:hypothetical protein